MLYNIYYIKYDIKINLDRKNMPKICKNSPEIAVKDNVTQLFILNSDMPFFNGLEVIKVKRTDN